MRKILLLFAAALSLTACEKPLIQDENGNANVQAPTKRFTFTVKGEFANPTFTRGYLATDKTLTDIWVFDYMDAECVQSLHQSQSDESWGEPTMQLRYGTHHIYFVASKGETPTIDESAHTITWETTKDTFWKDYEVEVVGTSNGNRAVTLERVATKLRVSISDEIPANISTLVLTPQTWYYGLDYVSGLATSPQKKDRTISIPSSYIGTTGQLSASILGLSNSEEWQTDVTITANDANGNSIGSVTISNAPFIRNRSTEYSGSLFQPNGLFSMSLADTWKEPYNASW